MCTARAAAPSYIGTEVSNIHSMDQRPKEPWQQKTLCSIMKYCPCRQCNIYDDCKRIGRWNTDRTNPTDRVTKPGKAGTSLLGVNNMKRRWKCASFLSRTLDAHFIKDSPRLNSLHIQATFRTYNTQGVPQYGERMKRSTASDETPSIGTWKEAIQNDRTQLTW